jgi:hypothetical protein
VQFEHDRNLEKGAREKPICDDCEKEFAVVYCDADKAYLCKGCDANLHKTKISCMHVRKAIGEVFYFLPYDIKGVDVFGMCKSHPTRQVQYFCSQCHEPVCIDCTVMGSHAKAEPGKHTLVTVEDYFKSVLEESKLKNPPLEERRIVVKDQIANIQSRADAVVDMGRQITSKIDEICSNAKKECNAIIERKLTILVGDEQELRRQIGEIDRLENFLRYQQDGDTMNCVSTWHLHQLSRERLCDFQFFRHDIDVQLDAKISGKVAVIIDQDQAAMSTNVSPVRKPNLPQRPLSPANREVYLSRSPEPLPPNMAPKATYYTSPSAPYQFGIMSPSRGMVNQKLNSKNANLPKQLFKSPERKVERRTSVRFQYNSTF